MHLTFTHLFINDSGSRTSNSGTSLGVACCMSACQQINVYPCISTEKENGCHFTVCHPGVIGQYAKRGIWMQLLIFRFSKGSED